MAEQDLSILNDVVGVCLDCASLDKSWKSLKDGDQRYKGLYVEGDLTHSDKLINGRLYFRDKMSAGVRSWTYPYFKPVTRHHEEGEAYQDPIGRVINATYIDTIDTLGPDYFRFKDLRSEEARQVLAKMVVGRSLQDKEFQGTGFTKGYLDITDKESIEKVMDLRYLTLSVDFQTDKRVCSVCGTDWIKEGMCEHMPGTTVDGEYVFHMTGDLRYNAVSFVNTPGDNLAMTTHIGGPASVVDSYCFDCYDGKCNYLSEKVEGFNMFKDLMDNLNSGTKIKMEDLLLCEDIDSFALYGVLELEDKYRLTEEQFKALTDSQFCYKSGKVLPIVDLAHFEAAKKFLLKFEDTEAVNRARNQAYYRARKLGLSHAEPDVIKMGEDKEFDITDRNDFTNTYIKLKTDNLMDSLSEEEKAHFDNKLKVLNLELSELEAKFAELNKKDEPAADAETQEEENKEETEQKTEDSQNQTETQENEQVTTPEEEKKEEQEVITVDKLHTMFNELKDEDKEELISMIDKKSTELTDKYEELYTKCLNLEKDAEDNKKEIETLKSDKSVLKTALAESIVDYKIILNKPNSDGPRADLLAALLTRTEDSLMDTIKDLRQELLDLDETPENEEANTDSGRNEEVPAKKPGNETILDYNEITSLLFKKMI